MKYLLISILISLSVSAEAQLGKFIKEKAKSVAEDESLRNKLRDSFSERLDDARAELDSTSFSMAISVSDNSDLVNTDSGKDKAIKLFTAFKTEEDASEEEKARNLKDAGELAFAKGYYKKSEQLFLSSKLAFETNSIDNINYHTLLSNLGLLYGTMGRFNSAEEFTREALEKRRALQGERSFGYGVSLNNLAVLQNETGDYNEAEKTIAKSIEILKESVGTQGMEVAIAMNNQAMLFQSVGRYDAAVETMNEVIKISSAIQNEKSNNHQKFLSNLALLERESGNYTKAIEIYNELIAIKKRRLGTRHPDYAHMLNNLGSLYLLNDQEDKVEPLLQESLEIYEKKFSKDHQLYAGALMDLGIFYRYQSKLEEAKRMLVEAEMINKKVLGRNHPDYIQSLLDMAIINWKLEDYEVATVQFDEVLNQSITFINNYFPPMSEAEKTKYWEKLRPAFESYYSFAFDQANPLKSQVVPKAYNYHIATKGLLLSTSGKIKSKILNSSDEELKTLYLQWQDQKATLAQYYNYSKEELKEQKVNLDSLEQSANATEKELSQKSTLFKEGLNLSQVKVQDVANQLNDGEVAVEIIRFRYAGRYLGEEIKYAAVGISKGKEPKYVLLNNGKQLETRYFKYYNNAIHQKIEDTYSYEQYWKPLEPIVSDFKTVYLSPDGVFNQINLSGLYDGQSYVLDSYSLDLVGNTKSIAKRTSPQHVKDAVLVGNPEFGSSTIAPLPGTAAELEAISKNLKSTGTALQLYARSNASEENLKSVKSPELLHIATHGYFLEDVSSDEKVFGVSVESARSNPLLRSGLLLANAGSHANETASMNSSDNGVLTAFEAINLDLTNTALVVLSACETAVGDVKAGEGVYGLQRAFMGAGANSLLMSLWKVDDAATQELMTQFYANWLSGTTMKTAFYNAQKKLKQKYAHPYYWSAFVLVNN